ncbi:MAG: N-acetylmuramoyl-L-alanine amidase [Clostridia bacterium]|nr:N-acetylmuramoyl-L-alanine amidase [Clostridia bacterium]
MSDIIPTISTPVTSKVVIIDAGHGGFDPGAISSNGTLEKDINIKIAVKLQELFEKSGTFTIMTRVSDDELGSSKKEDMRARKEIRDINDGSLFISIHLNSFPDGKYSGAQVFYPKDEESKKLATCIQNSIKENIDNKNDRVAKELSDVYILKQVKIPSVIVECGFLSNSVEERKLKEDAYQEEIAWAIYLGALSYYQE